jgi:hypothetical protein
MIFSENRFAPCVNAALPVPDHAWRPVRFLARRLFVSVRVVAHAAYFFFRVGLGSGASACGSKPM